MCVAEGKSSAKFSSWHVFLYLGKICHDRCVVVVVLCSVEFFLSVSYCVLYFLLLNMMSAVFMFVELYYQRWKSWSNRPYFKYIYVVFSYIYSCSLLNIIILKPSR